MSAERHDCAQAMTYDDRGARCSVCGAAWTLIRNKAGKLMEYRLVRHGRAA